MTQEAVTVKRQRRPHDVDLLKVFSRDGDDPASSGAEMLGNLLVDLVRLRRLDHEDFHRLHNKGPL
jgi:hypothetical protein